MSSWTENDFMKMATELAQKSVSTSRPIVDLVEKVAREGTLAPDEIRTLTRLTNVAALKVHFEQKTGADKQVEYAVGDAEEVIHRIHAQPVKPQSATAANDSMAKTASYSDFDLAEPIETVKLAAFEEPAEATVKPAVLRRKLAAARSEFEIDKISKAHLWDVCVSKVALYCRRAPGYGHIPYEELEKDAFAQFGDAAEPELVAVCQELRRDMQFDTSKVAHLQEHHTPVHLEALAVIKQAIDARTAYTTLARGIQYIDGIA